jgi:hypothetical protein
MIAEARASSEGAGSLLAALLPDDLRHDDEARAACVLVGDALEAVIRLARAPKG